MNELEGIIQAIEAEAFKPAPSHNNLARLVAMALRQIIFLKPELAEGNE